jgi:hypothetical protein
MDYIMFVGDTGYRARIHLGSRSAALTTCGRSMVDNWSSADADGRHKAGPGHEFCKKCLAEWIRLSGDT